MGGLHFDITGDNSNFLQKLEESRYGVRRTSKQIEESGMDIEHLFKRMTTAAAAFGVSLGAKQLVSDITRVRGEFQQLEVAFKTMLGSERQSNELMSQLVSTAAKTPFDLQGVANGAKQLLAYGTEAKDVNATLIRLGDIAAGLSIPLNDLVWLYGTTMTQGRLFTQDLRQFQGRGIPLADELAKQFGVTKDKVGELVTAGKVGFPEVQKAIEAMTNEGGKFGGLMEEQSKTISGQISNIEDSISTILNKIGKDNEGIINTALGGVSSLVENYEKVGEAIAVAITAYGSYKAALMTVSALQAANNIILKQAVVEKHLATAAGITLSNSEAIVAARTKILTIAQQGLVKALKAAAAATVANPYVLLAAAVTSLAYGIYKLSTAESDTEKVIRETNEALEAQKNHYEEVGSKARSLSNTLSDESRSVEERFLAYRKLQRLMPEVFKDMDWETAKRKTNTEFIRLETDEMLRQQRIGLKTNVVMSQQKVQGLENSIIKTTNAGGYTGALKEDLAAAKKELELYQKALDDFEKAKDEQEKDENKPTIFNKKYWEDIKKEAEAARDALDVSEEGSKKWNEYTKQILEAQKQIAKYSAPAKQRSQGQKEAAKQLKQEEQLAEQLLSIRRKNQQDEINLMEDATERKLKQIDLDYQRELDAIKKQRREWESLQGGKLTDEQMSTLGMWASNAAKGRESGISDVNRKKLESDRKAWQEYFIEYGNYQEKRKNLVQKYNDELAKLQKDSPEYAIKEAEKSKAIEQLDEQYGKSTKAMADLFEDASNKSVSAIQSIIDKYEILVKYMSGTDKDISIADLKGIGFTDKDIEGIEKGEISIKDVTDAIKGLKDELKGKSPWQAFVSDLEKGIEAIKKGGNDSKKIGQGITDIGNAVTSFTPALNEFGSSIADIFGFDDSKITSAIDALGGLGQTASGVGQIMSGDIVGGAMSAVSGISAVVSALDGMFGADYSHYNEMVEEYNKLNEIWDELIDKKLEYIGISYGMEADKVGEEALSLVEKQIEAYRLLGKERLNSGASAGSHSIGKRMAKNTSSSDWQDIADALDMSVNAAKELIGTGRMTGLFDLTVEQLEKLKSEAPAFWAKMDGDVQEYLNGIMDGEERIEDIQNQISEQLTQTTFDSVFDSFVDTLMDMGSSAKDFSDSFSEYMQRAVLTTMVGNKFTEDLQTWYDAFAQANKDQEGITKEEMEALRKQYDAIAGSAIAERDKLAEIFGWTKEDTDSSTDNYEDFIGSMQSSLTSLDVTAKDVSDNIYDYFRQAMINALYEKEYKSKMEELYKTFEGLSKDGLSESDMAQLGSQIDQYIEQMMKGVEDVNSLFADKLKDAEDLQSFVDSVKSAMSSVEATAEDVTDNIFEYIRQQMVDKMFTDSFQPQIEEFYKKVQEAMSDGDITGAEKDALRNEAEKLANDITAAKDILSDTLGITESNLKKELEEEFKSFSDGILSSLYDTEVTAETVAKNISDSMRRELIEAMYLEQYEPRIKAIWEKWKEYSEDGLVTDEERTNIKNDIDGLSKEVADAAGEISDAWKDSGEEVRKAFNSFSDSIKSVLYDAEATAEDIADNIYQYMRNALVDSMFTAQLQPQIQAWYDKYTEFMKDGAIDTAERKTLDEMIAEIQKAGVDIVDAANKLFPTLDTGAINRAEEAAQEAENARNEAEQEWESFSDGILNSLYDIEATAEDISDDMSEYMRKALIKAMYVENFKPQMQKWYNEWKKAMGDDDLTSEEKQLLDSMKQTMVDDMKKEVDAINQFFGTMFSQQASSKGFETMSQDTGIELNGRFTALQIAGEETKNAMLSMLAVANVISVSVNDNSTTLMEIKNLIITSNGHLEDIAKYTKELIGFKQTIANIENSAKAMAGK